MNSLISYASSDDEEEEVQAIPSHTPCTQTESRTPTARSAAEVPGTEQLPEQQPSAPPITDSLGSSPYSTIRSALRNLTMPPTPNFSIPASPPPPPTNSESSATLAARTKKLERFLDLKGQGVHFNSRLEGSSALRNPALLGKLMAFAGMGSEESYASSLGEGSGVAVRWPEGCDAAALVKANERREKKQKRPVDFVAESAGRDNMKKSRFDR